jgi:hypothetical protein
VHTRGVEARMRWFSYDGLALGVIAAIVVVFCIADYVWYKRQLAKQAKLASGDREWPYVGPSAAKPQLDSESQRADRPDAPG